MSIATFKIKDRVMTPHGKAIITLVDQETSTVRVKHLEAKTPVTDYKFTDLTMLVTEARSYSELEETPLDILIDEYDTIGIILSRREILPIDDGTNVITIMRDKLCKMAEVMVNGKTLMMGNFHDFHPGCHGGLVRVLGELMGKPNWSSYITLTWIAHDYIKSKRPDAVVDIQCFDAEYKDSGDWDIDRMVPGKFMNMPKQSA